jgi:hypothetical protein
MFVKNCAFSCETRGNCYHDIRLGVEILGSVSNDVGARQLSRACRVAFLRDLWVSELRNAHLHDNLIFSLSKRT